MEPKTSIAIEQIQNDNVKEVVFAASQCHSHGKTFHQARDEYLVKT